MSKEYQIRLSGFGGQGIILAGIILGEAVSLYENRFAVQSQSYGPEARGGASRAEVIICNEEINLLEVVKPDLLLALSQQAYDKYGEDVREDGIIIADLDLVNGISDTGKKVFALPISRIAREKAGKVIVTNMVSLGVIAMISQIVQKESLEKAAVARVPVDTIKLNLKAIDLGFEAARKLLQKEGAL